MLKLLDVEFSNIQGEMERISYKVSVESFMYAMVDAKADLAFAVVW